MRQFKFGATEKGIHSEADLKVCPRKHQLCHEIEWSKGKGLQSNSREGYFSVGSAVHEGLAEYYESGGVAAAIERALEYLDVEHEQFPGILTDQLTISKTESTNLLAQYFEKYPLNGEEFEVVKTEHEVTVPLSDGQVFTVRIDLIVRYKADGRIFVLDHKTTSQAQEKYEKQFALDPQITGLIVGAREASGYPVTGVMVNAIRKKPVDFYRFPVLRHADDIERWKRDRMEIRRLRLMYEQAGYWPMFEGPGTCVDVITGKECLCRPICLYGGGEQVYAGLYQPRHPKT